MNPTHADDIKAPNGEQTTVQLGLTDENGRTETALYADQEAER